MAFRYFNQILRADESPGFLSEMSAFGRHWRLLLADGMALLVLAFVSFSLPLISGTQVSRALAAIFLVLGIIYLSHSMEFKQERGSMTRLLQGSLSFVIGGILFRYSGSGMMGITVGLTFYFLLGAVLSWTFHSEVRPHAGWTWGVFASITSFVLGLYMSIMFPFAPLWLPGAMLGLELLISGSGMMGFALSVRKYEPVSPSLDSEAKNQSNPEKFLIHNKHFHT